MAFKLISRVGARSLLWLAVVLLALAALSGRMLYGAWSEAQRAQEARARGDEVAQVRHLRRAMAFYLPGHPWVSQAKTQLQHLARTKEAAGDDQAALAVWWELRSAILALRGISRPFAADLPEINARIAALSQRDPQAAAVLRTPAGASAFEQRLNAPAEPAPAYAALGLLGFVLWVLGAGAVIYRGLGPEAGRTRAFWPALGLSALGFLLFCLGIFLA